MSNVRDFGATGDGTTDDTDAVRHAIEQGDGVVRFPRGTYRLAGTVRIDLARLGRTALVGEHGTAKLVMAAPGPAFHFLGTHTGSADPHSYKPQVWQRERMPSVAGLEIEGDHPDADGLLFEGVTQPTLSGVLIREVRTAVRVTRRARNVLIDGCHFYFNRGVGVHFDAVNLHQIIISASHISYCRLGGVRIDGGSEVRNLQIAGCDIEYNNNRSHALPAADAEPTAEIFLDARTGSIREGAITGCTIQATDSENGANVCVLGSTTGELGSAGAWTITGNLITNQRDNVRLSGVNGLTLTGNVFDTGYRRNVLVEHSRNVVLCGNSFGHNIDDKSKQVHTGIRIVDSSDVAITGVVLRDALAGVNAVPLADADTRLAALELVRCRRVNVTGSQFLDPAPNGVYVEDCSDLLLTGCTILEDRETKKMEAAVRWKGATDGSLIAASRLGRGTQGTIVGPEDLRREMIVE
jgi:hypothetical protein